MKTLLLAGTQEARDIAGLMAANKVDATASLAGATHSPKPLKIVTRIGGFGGEAAQENFLRDGGFKAIIDASHPFATRISRRSLSIAQRLGIAYLRVLRPEWRAQNGDNWHHASTAAQIATLIPKGARVLLATGANSIHDWSDLAEGRRLYCRRIDPTNAPFPFDGEWIVARPPFTELEERSLMKDKQIEWVVAKNSGGPTRAKLDAARALTLPVAMLDRPARQSCDHVETAQEAMEWLTLQNA